MDFSQGDPGQVDMPLPLVRRLVLAKFISHVIEQVSYIVSYSIVDGKLGTR